MLFTWEAPDVFMVQNLVSNLILQILPIFFPCISNSFNIFLSTHRYKYSIYKETIV